jgi:hypothetical protein
MLHDVTSPKGLQVNLEQDCQVSELSSYRAVLNSLDQSAKRSISSVKQRVAFHTVGGFGLSKTNSVRRSAEGIRQ